MRATADPALLERLRERLKARDFLAAAALGEELAKAAPDLPLVWLMLAEARRGLGDQDAALQAARRLAELSANDAWAHQLHALLAKRLKQYDEAEAAYRRALALAPGDAEGHCNLAAVLSGSGRHDEALVHLRQAVALQPDFAEAHTNLGAILVTLGQDAEGLAAHQRALEINPDSAIAQDNLGVALARLKRFHEAERAHRRAIELKPDHAAAHDNLGNLLFGFGAYDEAEVELRQALRFAPEHPDARDRLLAMQAYLGSSPPVALRREAERWELHVLDESERRAAREQRFARASREGRRLRLGILSAEFGQHPVAYFLLSWLRALDRSRFELLLYSTNDRQNQGSNALFRELADQWRSIINLGDAQAVEHLRADRIDVLIETTGHTSDNRLGVIARRVAPVQAHYIGYFATTGLSQMDYFIGDGILIPPEHDAHFTETVWRLPRTRYAYEPLEQAPEPCWSPAPDGRLRIGSFNDLAKVRGQSLALWARVLRALPEACLVLKDRKADDDANRRRLLRGLLGHGIDPERVEFRPATDAWAEHMAAYNRLDIALDSVPFNSATTAFDALWMGTPLVSLLGDRLSGRQAASALTGLGRPEWIASDADDYVARVVALARDPDQRRQIRETQRARMRAGELCDGGGLARVLEDAFEHMFDRWQSAHGSDAPGIVAPSGTSLLTRRVPAASGTREPLELFVRDIGLTGWTPAEPLTVALTDGGSVRVPSFSLTTNALVGRSSDGHSVVKIELRPALNKRNDLLGEAGIIDQLNRAGCVSCPRLIGVGEIASAQLPKLPELSRLLDGNALPERLPALVLEYIPTQAAVPIHDLLFAIEEQRQLGWFHWDLNPANLRLCPRTRRCVLLDYDQAAPLTEAQRRQPLVDFLRWADRETRLRFTEFYLGGLFEFHPGITLEEHILPQLENGRIDLGRTSLLQASATTLNPTGIYHAIDLPDIVAHGERSLAGRRELLDRIAFQQGERVLDIGCNLGLLCAYLARRGCVVTGHDLDPYVISAARMLANIRGERIAFARADLDDDRPLGKFDSVLLFSVLHHSRHVVANAARIASSCRRILIETRLREAGAKPVEDRWIDTTRWSYANLDALIEGLEALFPGFRLALNHGQADRDRFLLEFVKAG